MKSSKLEVDCAAPHRPRAARTIVRVMVLVAVFCLLAFLPQAAAATPLVSVENVTVEEGDSTLFRRILVPISWSNAVHLRVRIEVIVRRRAGGRPTNRLIAIRPLSTGLTLHGTGATTIAISVRGDLDREPDEVADVRLTFLGPVQGGDVGVFRLRDDDHPTVTVSESLLAGGRLGRPAQRRPPFRSIVKSY